jgi:hypothetical protein
MQTNFIQVLVTKEFEIRFIQFACHQSYFIIINFTFFVFVFIYNITPLGAITMVFPS